MKILPTKLKSRLTGIASHLPIILSLIFLLTGPIAVSLWVASKHNSRWSLFGECGQSDFISGIFFGIALLAILICIAYKGLPEYRAPITTAVWNWPFLGLLFIGILLVFFVFCLLYNIEDIDEQDRASFLMFCLRKDPGGIFAIIIGIATVIGLYYTWQSLSEIKRTISSFSDLMDRVHEMAKNATASAPIKILAYTPAIGYLAQPIDDWNTLKDMLDRRPKGKPIAEIICLRKEDLKIWHNLFIGRRTLQGQVTDTMAEAATTDANNFLDRISSPVADKPPNNVHRLPWRFMPGFYLFITRSRAIIVTPLFLPFPKGAPKQQQERLPTVQMIGVETQDRAIIQDVENLFQYYKELPQHPLGETSESISSEVLQLWLADANKANDVMERLKNKLLESLKLNEIAQVLTNNPNAEIALGFDAYIKTWLELSKPMTITTTHAGSPPAK